MANNQNPMRWKVMMKRQHNFGIFKEITGTIKADALYRPRVNKITQL